MTGEEAVRHVFRIAASLDSLIVGEPQVLGQVKAAHRLSRTCGTIGADLETLLQAAYETAKKYARRQELVKARFLLQRQRFNLRGTCTVI